MRWIFYVKTLNGTHQPPIGYGRFLVLKCFAGCLTKWKFSLLVKPSDWAFFNWPRSCQKPPRIPNYLHEIKHMCDVNDSDSTQLILMKSWLMWHSRGSRSGNWFNDFRSNVNRKLRIRYSSVTKSLFNLRIWWKKHFCRWSSRTKKNGKKRKRFGSFSCQSFDKHLSFSLTRHLSIRTNRFFELHH